MSQNSLTGNRRPVWQHLVIGAVALVSLFLVGLGLAAQSGPQIIVVRGEFASPSDFRDSAGVDPASSGAPLDEVLGRAVVLGATAVAPANNVASSDGIAPAAATEIPEPTATAIPLPTASVVPDPTATAIPATVVPATLTPVPVTVIPIPATVVPAVPTTAAVQAAPPAALPLVSLTPVPVVSTAIPAVPTPVPVVPTAVPAPAPVIQAPVPTSGGPAGVVSQIPQSAWRWLDAHNWTVEWRQGPGPARVSEAQYATNTIVIWYDTARSDTFWAGAFGHELGHAVSWVHFSTGQMNDWNAQRGLSSWRWVPGMPNDFLVGEGDFAEAFMSYLLGHPIRSAGGPLSPAHRAWIAANTPF